jgi:hypothetical protein
MEGKWGDIRRDRWRNREKKRGMDSLTLSCYGCPILTVSCPVLAALSSRSSPVLVFLSWFPYPDCYVHHDFLFYM